MDARTSWSRYELIVCVDWRVTMRVWLWQFPAEQDASLGFECKQFKRVRRSSCLWRCIECANWSSVEYESSQQHGCCSYWFDPVRHMDRATWLRVYGCCQQLQACNQTLISVTHSLRIRCLPPDLLSLAYRPAKYRLMAILYNRWCSRTRILRCYCILCRELHTVLTCWWFLTLTLSTNASQQ